MSRAPRTWRATRAWRARAGPALLALAVPCASAAAAAAVAAQDPHHLEVLEANASSPWQVLGPFHSRARDGLGTAFIDEGLPDLARAHVLPDGRELRWQPEDPEHAFADGKHNRLDYLAGNRDTVYLARTITAVADHDAAILLGFDDSAALWVNGDEVFRKQTEQSVAVDQYRVVVRLRRGDNRILLKVVNNRGDIGFAFRLADPAEAASRWGAGLPGDGHASYRISTVPVPEELELEVGGLLFLPDASLLVSTRRGWIHRLTDPAADDSARLRISTFAEGLHEPLGMLREPDGSVLVAQMPELTRLRDGDGDGRADAFERVADDWGLSGNYHEYHFGPVRDAQGSLWGTLNVGFPSGEGDALRFRGSAYRVLADGSFAITCYGLRSPNGLVVNPAGDVFYADNQGEWMDVCRLTHLRPRKFYGHPVALPWAAAMADFGWEKERTLPAVWYPYHLMRSTSQPVVIATGGKFGPYEGQIIVGDQNNSLLVRTTLQQVRGVYQGACYPFWQGFAGGINRLAFAADGVLYVGLTNRGWGSVQAAPRGLQRFSYVGPEPFDLVRVEATHAGFDCVFTKPLSPQSDLAPRHVLVREYGYEYWSTYGSDEIDSRRVDVLEVTLSSDRRRVSLRTGPRNTGKAFQIAFRGPMRSLDGEKPIATEAFYTLLEIPDA